MEEHHDRSPRDREPDEEEAGAGILASARGVGAESVGALLLGCDPAMVPCVHAMKGFMQLLIGAGGVAALVGRGPTACSGP